MSKSTKSESGKTVDAKVAAVKAVSDPLKSAIEEVMSNTEIGNLIQCYDTGHADFDGAQIAEEAAEFVLKGLAGALCYNVIDGHRGNGQTMLNNALDAVDKAAERDANFRNEKSQEQLHQRIEWACRMDIQQAYRKSLQQFVVGLYTAITGERYQQRGVANSHGKPDTAEQSVAERLRARRTGTDS